MHGECVGKCTEDAESGYKDDAEGNQEASIGGEDGSCIRVVLSEFLHACEKLDEATIEEGSSDCNADASY